MRVAVLVFFGLIAVFGAHAQNFQSVWSSGSTPFSCSDSRATLITNEVLNLTLVNSNTRYFMGHNGSPSNPCVARFDGEVQIWCSCSYETGTDSGVAYGALLDKDFNILYVVFTQTAPQAGANDYTANTQSGWLSNYGNGSGKQVAVILALTPSTGVPTGDGTYIHATDSNGNSNAATLVRWEKLSISRLHVTFSSFSNPINVDTTPMTCTGTSPFNWLVDLSLDLSAAVSSTADGCTNNGGNTNSITSDTFSGVTNSLTPSTIFTPTTQTYSFSPTTIFTSFSSRFTPTTSKDTSSDASVVTGSLAVMVAALFSALYFF